MGSRDLLCEARRPSSSASHAAGRKCRIHVQTNLILFRTYVIDLWRKHCAQKLWAVYSGPRFVADMMQVGCGRQIGAVFHLPVGQRSPDTDHGGLYDVDLARLVGRGSLTMCPMSGMQTRFCVRLVQWNPVSYLQILATPVGAARIIVADVFVLGLPNLDVPFPRADGATLVGGMDPELVLGL